MSVTAAEKNWECSQDILTILDLESSASASLRAGIQVAVSAVQGSSWVRQGRNWICWVLVGRSPGKCDFIGLCSTSVRLSHPVTAGATKIPKPNLNPYQLPKLFPTIPTPHFWDTEDAGGASLRVSPWIQVIPWAQGRCCPFPRCPRGAHGAAQTPQGAMSCFLWLPGKPDIFVLQTEPCKVI